MEELLEKRSPRGSIHVEQKHTVDGRNPAPVDRWVIPLFTRIYTSERYMIFLPSTVVWCRLAIGWCKNSELSRSKTRWCFQIFFEFSSLPGEMIQIDEHIFQMGWFNHQDQKPSSRNSLCMTIKTESCRQLVWELRKGFCCEQKNPRKHRLFWNVHLLLPLWVWRSIQQLYDGYNL